MDLKIAGKTALITGGSKGIGRATAEVFAAEGCNVIIVSRTAETLGQVKSAIAQKSNVRVDTVAADLSDSKNVDRLAQDYPDIDILVNNAGAIPGGSAAQCGRGDLAQGLGPEGLRLRQHVPALLRADEGARARRDRQRGRQRRRYARSRIHLRRGR
jgi:NADP-dependent 3-hydroxy acid dehydrogenase YdfG